MRGVLLGGSGAADKALETTSPVCVAPRGPLRAVVLGSWLGRSVVAEPTALDSCRSSCSCVLWNHHAGRETNIGDIALDFNIPLVGSDVEPIKCTTLGLKHGRTAPLARLVAHRYRHAPFATSLPSLPVSAQGHGVVRHALSCGWHKDTLAHVPPATPPPRAALRCPRCPWSYATEARGRQVRALQYA